MGDFGGWLKTARKRNNIGLRQFASQVGFSPTYVSVVESNKERPSRRFVAECEHWGETVFEAYHAAGMIPDEIETALLNDHALMIEVRGIIMSRRVSVAT